VTIIHKLKTTTNQQQQSPQTTTTNDILVHLPTDQQTKPNQIKSN